MAETSNGQSSLGSLIFRETALNKMASVDDLDRYLKVTNPSAWVLLGAVAALLVAAIVWGFTATLPVQQSTTGVLKDGQVVCFLPLDGTTLATTDTAVKVAGHDTRIASIDNGPYSRREVAERTNNDYIASQSQAQWSYLLLVETPKELSEWEEGDDVPVQITMKEVAPFAYLFSGAQS